VERRRQQAQNGNVQQYKSRLEHFLAGSRPSAPRPGLWLLLLLLLPPPLVERYSIS
jgi:hypothetical protein